MWTESGIFRTKRLSCASGKINCRTIDTEEIVAVEGYLAFLQQVYPRKRYQQQLYIHITEFMSILFAKKYCILLTTRVPI